MKQREIEERAAYWLIEQDDPDFSAEQRAAFVLWLSEDTRHRDTYAALERGWHRTLILRRKPATRDRLCRDVTQRLMSTRNLEVHDAERLTQGAFELLRAPHHAPHFESDPWFPLEPVVARNITQDWLCFTLDFYDILERGTCDISRGFDIDHPLLIAIEAKSYQAQHLCRVTTKAARVDQVSLVRELIELLAGAVENLSSRTKQVYTLRKVHGLSEDEIAGELHLTPDTVSEHLDHAAYHCATEVINGLPPERQSVLFASLDACRRKRSALT